MYTTIAISSLLIVASNALALPQVVGTTTATTATNVAATAATDVVSTESLTDYTGTDNQVTVTLLGSGMSQTTFDNADVAQAGPPTAGTGTYETIEISLGDTVTNAALRCSAFDAAGTALIATRGDNTDTTFSDAEKGPWTFLEPVEVAEIRCDPAFVAVAPGSYDIVVQLSGDSELATQTTLSGVARDVQVPIGSPGPYTSVTITPGALVDPAVRCKLRNAGRPIVAVRDPNTDTTFSGGNPWLFQKASNVAKIICDPAFVAAPQ